MYTQEMKDLRSIWRYDPDTGLFHWKVFTYGNGRKIIPGDVAGTLKKEGYIQLRRGKKAYKSSRVAWFFMAGQWPPKNLQVEHRNSDKSDNRWFNLDLVPASKNRQNPNDRLYRSNKSGHRGVAWVSGAWRAQITVNRQLIVLGRFHKIADAVAARREGELRYFKGR